MNKFKPMGVTIDVLKRKDAQARFDQIENVLEERK